MTGTTTPPATGAAAPSNRPACSEPPAAGELLDESATYAAALERSTVLDSLIDERAEADPQRFRMLTGDRPTGPLHIGHYLASLRNRVRLQNKGVETFVVIADYQVITDRDVGRRNRRQHARHRAGLPGRRSRPGAHDDLHAQRGAGPQPARAAFLSLVTEAELRRNPTVKDELALSGGAPVGPAAHLPGAPGGRHPLLPRRTRAGRPRPAAPPRADPRHRPTLQQPVRRGQRCSPSRRRCSSDVPLLLGTDGTKMSKSKGNTVDLRDTADETAARIRAARTDSERPITFDPRLVRRSANLLTIAGLFLGEAPQSIAEQVSDSGAARLKAIVTDAVNDGLAGHRSRRAAAGP